MGPCVTEQAGSGTAPVAAGGAILAGTYTLIESTLYGGGTPQNVVRKTMVASNVSGTSFTLNEVQQSGTRRERSTGTVTTSGTTATYVPTCPDPGDGGDSGGSAGFTATSTTFTLIMPRGGGGTRVEVYTRS